MPAILERVFPFLLRRHREQAITRINSLTDTIELWGNLDARQFVLWRDLETCASGISHQLLIRNADPYLDLGLKPHLGKFDTPEVVTLQYWLTLYLTRVFSQRGFAGFETQKEYPVLVQATDQWVAWMAKQLHLPVPNRWTEWENDSIEMSAMYLCQAVYNMIGVPVSPGICAIRSASFSVSAGYFYAHVESRRGERRGN